ncbi:MAG: protein kinase [Aphanocapsa sp. GSE-SYN-MK-11-07L]|jgi:serine/threonine-protein kinase|nr:protein kinase [Aphanocapsa sp. GSE-SYN-MK-11-07L]
MQLIELRGYRIIRPLGQGGFGKTYLVEDIHSPTFQQYVVKQLSPQCTDPDSYKIAQERFQREAAVLLDLSNKHFQIPKLYSYSFQDQDFYLVQEYIEGPSLLEMWQQAGEITEDVLRQILIEILDILSVVHAQKIIHRDVKPENIIIRSSDQKPVLIDFGAVKESVNTRFSSHNSAASIAIGSPGFMPPEQAAGRPTYASDLYSLGMTAIYLLTGKQPSELETDAPSHELIWQPHAPQVSPGLAAVLTKAIKFNPSDRYASAHAMQQALGGGSSLPPSGEDTLAVVPPAKPVAPKTYPVVWLLILAGIVGAGGVLGVVGFYLFSQFSQPRSETSLATAINARSQGQFEDCLAALSRLPITANLPPEAKSLQAECQLELAKQRAAQGDLTTALQQVSQIDPNSIEPNSVPATESAQLQQQWGDRLLAEATKKYEQGDVEAAIKLARAIPKNTLSAQKAEAKIRGWQQTAGNPGSPQPQNNSSAINPTQPDPPPEHLTQNDSPPNNPSDGGSTPISPTDQSDPPPSNAQRRIDEGEAISTIEALYTQLSQRNYPAARDMYGPQLAAIFEPGFFEQFTRVTVDNLSITSRTNKSISFVGDNTYVWPDGSTQRERRSFTVRQVNGRPLITASEFIKVIYSRQHGT